MYKEINGVSFEVIDYEKAPKKYESLMSRAGYEARFLNQIYYKWSDEKQRIYDFWQEFCYQINGNKSTWGESAFSICSHNCMIFTLSFVTNEGVFYITPSHNYLLKDYKIK